MLVHFLGKLSFATEMQSFRLPSRLNKGDTIALVAPAKKLTAEVIDLAVHFLEEKGYTTWVGPNALKAEGGFAGSDSERAGDFQAALDNPNIKAILCLRGGYGSIRVLNLLDFGAFKKKPKWIAGFSDITLFHSLLNNSFGLCSLHSTMPLDFSKNSPESLDSLIHALKGKTLHYELPSSPKNRTGITSGLLIGGNLSLLHNLQGTELDFDPKDKILFIEEISESLYAVDRMIQSFKLAGKFEQLAGLVVGGMTRVSDAGEWFGNKDLQDLILEATKEFRFPIAFDFPAGHIPDNRCLVMGRMANLVIGDQVSLNFV